MSQHTINIERRSPTVTVSEMRRELARILAYLDGGQQVSFSFTAHLPHIVTPPEPEYREGFSMPYVPPYSGPRC